MEARILLAKKYEDSAGYFRDSANFCCSIFVFSDHYCSQYSRGEGLDPAIYRSTVQTASTLIASSPGPPLARIEASIAH